MDEYYNTTLYMATFPGKGKISDVIQVIEKRAVTE